MGVAVVSEHETWGRVAVGARLGRAPKSIFVACYTALIRDGLDEGDIVLDPAVGLKQGPALIELARRAIDAGCNSLLAIDDDMEFAVDSLKLLRAHRPPACELLAAAAVRRDWPPMPAALIRRRGHLEIAEPEGEQPMLVAIAGLHFTLVGGRTLSRLANGLWELSNAGEDVELCNLINGSGGTVYVDPRVPVGHISDLSLWPQHYLRWRQTPVGWPHVIESMSNG